MPKKRHQSKYSKPPSVAPPILSSSSSRATPEHHERSVNQILADLRRSSLTQSGTSTGYTAATPTVPPLIRQILQIPETPAPPPRRLQRREINGRRAPPGPPPPRSWVSLAQSRHAPPELKASVLGRIQIWPLPGTYAPDAGSFVDQVLRQIALDWDQQRRWNKFYLYTLPSRLRTTLLSYVLELHGPGITIKDLRLILAGPAEEDLAQYEIEKPDLVELNGDLLCLDLAGAVGKSLTLKELNELLGIPREAAEPDLQDSWDVPAPTSGPVKLLPNLSQLSLAVDPGVGPLASWKQLLSLATKLPTLTHLNLSGWPEPSLTPNAKFVKVTSSVATGRLIQYAATGPYSHDLDGEWSEAILVLKRLSKSLYSLEYLDLTGCGDWFPALMKESDGTFMVDFVDWAGDWGKIMTLRLCSGYAIADDSTIGQVTRFADWAESATAVEKHIIAQRSGRGRWISVEKDTLSESAKAVIASQRLRGIA
ncbi:hypothetical protein GGS23DRAFT_289530 [Durotheca rogersii]|uniref:uncharacterized protein n=1 Tax=Durotheca rogersii TaxID=419775 RepID=UPI00221E7C20|nr:uncharacterized protein GGS23DRAFT_289530 [Durotheca rogersii]KAI5866797.1 hypothetical protein GGS23DRAFT_289530 [Durotheca rogersii]